MRSSLEALSRICPSCVKEPASSDCLRAHKGYRAAHAYDGLCGRARRRSYIIGTFFPELPLLLVASRVSSLDASRYALIFFSEWVDPTSNILIENSQLCGARAMAGRKSKSPPLDMVTSEVPNFTVSPILALHNHVVRCYATPRP